MEDYRKGMGKRISELRKQLSMSREDLLDRVGISEGYLGLIERGRRGASVPHLIAIAETLNISLDYLITGYEKEIDHEDYFLRFMNQFNADEKELFIQIGNLLIKNLPDLEGIQSLVNLFVDYKNKKSGIESHQNETDNL